MLKLLKFVAIVVTLRATAAMPQVLAQSSHLPTARDAADELLYRRAFEVALWAMPAADSFAAREAEDRDLHGRPNDVVINTKPLNSDIHLVALQTTTPYLTGAFDLTGGPIVVEIPAATNATYMYGTICDA